MMRKNKNTDLAKSTDASRDRALQARSAWDRFDDVDRWFEDLRREFDRKFWGPLAPWSGAGLAVREPLVDLADTGREYVLKADLPGVSKEDLDLRVTPDGIESGFAVNVIAPFLLTHLLLDSLKASPGGRVISVMGGDVPAALDLSNLQAERSFNGLSSYSPDGMTP